MHIEKTVFEQIINIVMNVIDKTKDDLNAREDMPTHYKRKRLNLLIIEAGEGSRWEVMPQAPYVLQKEHRKVVCEWICKMKFLDG